MTARSLKKGDKVRVTTGSSEFNAYFYCQMGDSFVGVTHEKVIEDEGEPPGTVTIHMAEHVKRKVT